LIFLLLSSLAVHVPGASAAMEWRRRGCVAVFMFASLMKMCLTGDC
jgi:hypothetical protein